MKGYKIYYVSRLYLSVRSIAHNVLQLGEVADFEKQRFDLAQMFIRNPKLDLSTEPAILPNCCYLLVRFITTKLELERKRFFFSFFVWRKIKK